jgi:hypothetical protein
MAHRSHRLRLGADHPGALQRLRRAVLPGTPATGGSVATDPGTQRFRECNPKVGADVDPSSSRSLWAAAREGPQGLAVLHRIVLRRSGCRK